MAKGLGIRAMQPASERRAVFRGSAILARRAVGSATRSILGGSAILAAHRARAVCASNGMGPRVRVRPEGRSANVGRDGAICSEVQTATRAASSERRMLRGIPRMHEPSSAACEHLLSPAQASAVRVRVPRPCRASHGVETSFENRRGPRLRRDGAPAKRRRPVRSRDAGIRFRKISHARKSLSTRGRPALSRRCHPHCLGCFA